MNSGGSDFIKQDDGSAWFTGTPRDIRICYEISPGFGVSPQTLRNDIQAAYADWKNYLERKDAFEFDWNNANLHLAFNTEILPQCDGSQDLTFYFGVENGRIHAAKKLFNNPDAFALRTGYDNKRGWGSGFIWFSDKPSAGGSWSNEFNLKLILTHEIGRTLGMERIDVPGTVMDERIDQYEIGPNNLRLEDPYPIKPNPIDGTRELLTCDSECTATYHGTIGDTPGVTGGPASAEKTFRLFTGRDPVGKIHATVDWDTIQSGTPDMATLTLKDDSGSFQLPIEYSGATAIEVPYTQHILYISHDLSAIGAKRTAASISFGTIRAANGQAYPVQLKQNTDGAFPFAMTYTADDGETFNLFTMPSNSADLDF